MLSYRNTADEIQNAEADTAIVPIGSLEQHGAHLPVNTDNYIAEALADALGRRLPAYVLPVIPISTCREHMGKRGSVWMRPETFYQMIQDVCLSLKEQGFRKIVLLQMHGGIFILPPAVRQLNAAHNPDLMVCLVDYQMPSEAMRRRGDPLSTELHAGEGETSMLLYLRPELTHMELARDCLPDVPREYLNYASIFHFSPGGTWGYPTKADADTGYKMIEAFAEDAADYVTSVFELMEHKGNTGYSAF